MPSRGLRVERRLLGVLTAGLLVTVQLACGTSTALAQQPLPDKVISAAVLSPEDKQLVGTLVDASKGGLTGDIQAIRRSRNALVAPLRDRGVSLALRLEMSERLVPVVRPLAGDAREEVAINALRIAGELGTRPGVEILLPALEDKRTPVRVMAAMGLARALATTQTGSAALLPAQAIDLLQGVRNAMSKETDPIVLDALAMTFEAGLKLPAAMEGVAGKSAELLPSAASQVARRCAAPAQTTLALGRATRALGEALRNSSGGAGAGPVSKTAAVEVGAFAGDVLAHVQRRLAAGGTISDAERGELALLVAQAETTLGLAQQAAGQPAAALKLEELVAGGRDDEFAAQAAAVIGENGTLTKAPFAQPAARFKDCQK